MRIGVDIDCTLTNGHEVLRELAESWFGRRVSNPAGYTVRELFDCSLEEDREFWRVNNLKYIEQSKPIEGIESFVERCLRDGHTIIPITDRLCHMTDTKEIQAVKYLTSQFLNANIGKYKGPVYSNGDKAYFARMYKLDLMYEDYVGHIVEVSKVCPVMYPRRPYNEHLSLPNTIMYERLT